MADEFDILNPPPLLSALDAVPEPFRGMYELDDVGLYALTSEAKRHVAVLALQRKKIDQDHTAAVEALRRDAGKISEELDELRVTNETRAAALQYGCRPEMVTAVVAIFRDQARVVDDKAVVATDAGDVPLRTVVKEYMASEAGNAFKPRRMPGRDDNSFAARFSRIAR